MKKAILIDDEKYCTETLEFELNRSDYPLEIVAKCNDSRNAVEIINSLKPDIVFLDIEMPWMNGFDVLDALNNIDFHLIFVTAYDQFALKAFEYFAINYLLKPVNKVDLNKTLEKIHEIDSPALSEISKMIQVFEKSRKNKHLIAFPVNTGYEFYDQSTIVRCEADSNYCNIYFDDSKQLLISKSLKVVEELLGDQFFRLHQSHLINLNKIKKYDKSDGGTVIMQDGTHLPISRLRKSAFTAIIKEWRNL